MQSISPVMRQNDGIPGANYLSANIKEGFLYKFIDIFVKGIRNDDFLAAVIANICLLT